MENVPSINLSTYSTMESYFPEFVEIHFQFSVDESMESTYGMQFSMELVESNFAMKLGCPLCK